MGILPWLELVYKIIATACGVLTLYIGLSNIVKARKSKIKRNASNDVPK